ncbi:MAG: hypothetical protein EA381_13850 [Planctomycetaceae bacterium]|nr:MAG: hypothetical protein EA381_13850 [Planctomycetaceae bacterium]
MNHPATADLNRPFPGVPVRDRYLPIGPIEDAKRRIARMIDRGESLAVVMGPPGTGKTLLGQKLLLEHQRTHRGVLLGQVRLGSRAGMIRQVLSQLERPIRGADEDSLHLELVESLTTRAGGFLPLLLVIDEAQTLTCELLEEVRMLTNLTGDGRALIQVVLLGAPGLEETLTDPHLESFVQRISARCYLHPLTESETGRYIRESLAPFGREATEGSIRAAHSACAGIPRLINHLMDRAVEIACQRQLAEVDDASVQMAWSDLQQLPSPVQDAELQRPAATEIEFGELDESSDRSPGPIGSSATAEANTNLREVLPGDQELESILRFASIDCFSPAVETPAWPGFDLPAEQAPSASSPAGTAPSVTAPAATAPSDEALFGEDFESDTAIELHAVETSAREFAAQDELEEAVEELRLHEQVRRLSRTAVAALRGEIEPRDFEVSSTDQPDDRDLLVIEEDVITLVEEPHAGPLASGGMRKPPREVDQRYQDLFSRLRRQR